jgi:hypothetical protein
VINLLDELKSRQGDQPDLALRLWYAALALLVVFRALLSLKPSATRVSQRLI